MRRSGAEQDGISAQGVHISAPSTQKANKISQADVSDASQLTVGCPSPSQRSQTSESFQQTTNNGADTAQLPGIAAITGFQQQPQLVQNATNNALPATKGQDAVPGAMTAKQALTMTTRHKSNRQLSPIKQRVLHFRETIGTNKAVSPSYTADDMVKGLFEYDLPPSAQGAALSPTLLSDLDWSPGKLSHKTADLMGTYSLASPAKQQQQLGTTYSPQRKPFHSAIKGPLPAPSSRPAAGMNMVETSAVHGKTVVESIVQAMTQSQQAEYTFDVPPHVKTGLDAVTLFSSGGAKPGLIITCNLNPAAIEYNPYDLVVCHPDTANTHMFFAITQSGVMQMCDGEAYEQIPHHQWVKDAEMFAVLKKLVLFKKHGLFKAFKRWHGVVRTHRFQRRQKYLSQSLVMLSPTFSPALLRVRNLALSAVSDDSGKWVRQKGNKGQCTWVSTCPDNATEAVTETRDSEGITSGLPSNRSSTSQLTEVPFLATTSSGILPCGNMPPLTTATSATVQQSNSTSIPLQQGSLQVDTSSSQLPKVTGLSPTKGLQASRALHCKASNALECPSMPTLQGASFLTPSSLVSDLSDVGGPQELYTFLDVFQQLRAKAKGKVQEALAVLCEQLVEQVLAVGTVVMSQLQAASARLAPLTRKQAFEARFKQEPGQAKKENGSPAFANEAHRVKTQALAAACYEAAQMRAFIAMVNLMVVTAMHDLGQAALAITCQKLFMPRRQGLFTVTATINEVDTTEATEVVRCLSMQRGRQSPSLGPPSGSCVPLCFTPSLEDVTNAVQEVVRDIVAVVSQAGVAMVSHLEIYQLVQKLNTNQQAALQLLHSAIHNPHYTVNIELASLVLNHPGHHATSITKHKSLPDTLATMLGTTELLAQLSDRISKQYNTILQHTQLKPFIAHRNEWALVCCFNAEAYQAAGYTPDHLNADVLMLRAWVEELSKCSTTSVYGLLHFDLAATRASLMPRILDVYQTIIVGLPNSMVNLQKELMSRLGRYINLLRTRPSELPDFVSHMEVIWPHLDEGSFKRQRVKNINDKLGQLYATIMAAVPPPEEPDVPENPTPWLNPNGTPEENEIPIPRVTIDVGGARPVHMMGRKLQAEVARYLEEASAAADFIQHSSGLMTNHLKNELLQIESELLQLLSTLRLGISTRNDSKPVAVKTQLKELQAQLTSMETQVARCSVWSKLLAHPSVNQVLGSVERLSEALKSLIESRRQLWVTMERWTELLDSLYTFPATTSLFQVDLLPYLNKTLAELEAQTNAITALHISDDVSSTQTVTPPEAHLGTQLSMVVRSWTCMAGMAVTLTDVAVKPRHILILIDWLQTLSSKDGDSHHTDNAFREMYPVPTILEQESALGMKLTDLAAPESICLWQPARTKSVKSDTNGPLMSDLSAIPLPGGVNSGSGIAADAVVASGKGPEQPKKASVTKPVCGMSLAQLLSTCSVRSESKALLSRATALANAEYALLQQLAAGNARLHAAELRFLDHRVSGVFVITNGNELTNMLKDLDEELAGLTSNPSSGGVIHEIEMLEQLIRHAQTFLKAAVTCQDLWSLMSGVMQSPEAQACAPGINAALQPLLGVWKKYTLLAQQSPGLMSLQQTMPELLVLQDALIQIKETASQTILPCVRQAYPRTFLVPDDVLLTAVSVAYSNPSAIPKQLLSTCFSGLECLHCQVVQAPQKTASQSIPSLSQILISHQSVTALNTVPNQQPSHRVVAVTGSHTGTMAFVNDIVHSPTHTLAGLLGQLEAGLQASLRECMQQCLDACGQMQIEHWVSAFPTQCILLVDAVVWTQTATVALMKAAKGDRNSLRTLLDQTAMRLEGLGKALRTVQATTAAYKKRDEDEDGNVVSDAEDGGNGFVRVLKWQRESYSHSINSLKGLISAGIAHRQVAESLIASEATSPDAWEFVASVRHYWDANNQQLYVAFAQTRMVYGWDYQGSYVDVPTSLLTSAIPTLMAAAHALQVTPLVTLSHSSNVDARACTESLSTLLGKYLMPVCLSPDSTPATCARILQAAAATGAFLCIEGIENLQPAVLSLFSQQMYSIWAAHYVQSQHIALPLGAATDSVPTDSTDIVILSPWRPDASSQASVQPCAIFIAVPCTLLSGNSLQDETGDDANHASQLIESLHRTCRAVKLSCPDTVMLLEAALRAEGLRGAAEAARAVEACFRHVGMQLPPRRQYTLDLVRIKAVVFAIRQQLPGSIAGAVNTSSKLISVTETDTATAQGHATGNAMSLLNAALKAVLLTSAPSEDHDMITSIINTATLASRTPSPPDVVLQETATIGPCSTLCSNPYNSMLPTLHAIEASILSKRMQNVDKKGGQAYDGAEGLGGTVETVQYHPSGSNTVATSQWLAAQACKLATHLAVTGRCILLGQPGSGKTRIWKALREAVDDINAGVSLAAGNVPKSPLLRIYPSALPLRQALVSSNKSAHVDEHAVRAECLKQLIRNGLPSTAAIGDVHHNTSQAAGVSNSYSLVPTNDAPGIAWMVIDGPMNSTAAEIVAPYLGQRHVSLSNTHGTNVNVVGIPAKTLVVWECSSLSNASPALLVNAPVLNIGQTMTQSCLSTLVQEAASNAFGIAVARSKQGLAYATSEASAAQDNKPASMNVDSTAVSQDTAAIKRLSDFIQEGITALKPLVCGGVGDSKGITYHAGLENGDVFFDSSIHKALQLLQATVQTLRLQMLQTDDMLLVLARASLFCMYWTVAALPLPAFTRSCVETALRSATAAGLPAALPAPDICIASQMVDPKSGRWRSWHDAMTPLLEVRHGIHVPPHSRPAGIHDSFSAWHMYEDPLSHKQSLFLPSAATTSLQYVCQLSAQASMHALLIGGAGTGKATTLKHLLATTRLYHGRRACVQAMPLSSSSCPGRLSDLLAWKLDTSTHGKVRPPFDSHVVLFIEDISCCVASAEQQQKSTAAPCLEWLRQVLDDGSIISQATGQYEQLQLSGVSVAATAGTNFMLVSPHDTARLWRHMHIIHTHAALASSETQLQDHMLPPTVAGTQPVLTLFSAPGLVMALGHSCMLKLATGPAKLPQLQARGPPGVASAGCVLGTVFMRLLLCVRSLQRLGLVDRHKPFGIEQLEAILQRKNAAAEHWMSDTASSWTMKDDVHRLLYSMHEELAANVATQEARDVLARVTLHAIGKDLGTLLSGKYNKELTTMPQPFDSKRSSSDTVPLLGSDVIGFDLPQAAAEYGNNSEDDARNLDLWKDQTKSGKDDGNLLTALRLSMIGKVLPSDIDQLYAAACGAFLRDASMQVAGLITDTQQPDSSGHTAVSLRDSRITCSANQGGQEPSTVLSIKWPAWLRPFPTLLTQLPERLKAMLILDTASNATSSLGFSLHNLPTSAPRQSLNGDVTQRSNPEDSQKQSKKPPGLPGLVLPVNNVEQGDTSCQQVACLREVEPGHALIMADTMFDWELAQLLASCANVLSNPSAMSRRHLLLTGSDLAGIAHLAQLSALGSGAKLLSLDDSQSLTDSLLHIVQAVANEEGPFSVNVSLAPTETQQPSSDVVVVVNELHALDDDFMNTLQSLLTMQTLTGHVSDAFNVVHAQDTYQSQLQDKILQGLGAAAQLSPPPTSRRMDAAAHAAALAVDVLRQLNESRPSNYAAVDATNKVLPGSPARVNETSSALCSPGRKAGGPAAALEADNSVEQDPISGLQCNPTAKTLVDKLHTGQAQKQQCTLKSFVGVAQTLRVALAVCDHTADIIRQRYPSMIKHFQHVSVAQLSQQDREKLVRSHILSVCDSRDGGLLQEIPSFSTPSTRETSSSDQSIRAAELSSTTSSIEETAQKNPATIIDGGVETLTSMDGEVSNAAVHAGNETTEDMPQVLGTPKEHVADARGRREDSLNADEPDGRHGRHSRATALACVIVKAHEEAQQLLREQGVIPKEASLPCNMVTDTINLLVRVHGAQLKALRTQQASLRTALYKLSPDSGIAAAATATDTQTLDVAIKGRTGQLDEATAKLATLNVYISRLETEVQQQEALYAEHRAVVDEVTSAIDSKLEAAQQKYQQALHEVGGLTEQDLAELKSYTNPPERVRLVMMAVTALFDAAPDWRSAQKLLGEQNPKLLDRLMNFDVRDVSVMAVAKLTRITSEPEFNIVQVGQVSQAARPLCWWTLCVHELLRVGREADLQRIKIAEAEQRLAQVTKYMRELQRELRAAKREQATCQLAHDEAEADIQELYAVMNDKQQAATNVNKLRSIAVSLTRTWETQLQEVEGKMQPLLGDSTLASLAITYLGVLNPSSRAAGLSAWQKLLQQHGISTSQTFDMPSFLATRRQQLLGDMTAAYQTTTHQTWLDVVSMASLAVHVPLIIDTGYEMLPLLKAQHARSSIATDEQAQAASQSTSVGLSAFQDMGRVAASNVVTMTILDGNLATKVTDAVSEGKVVVLDMLGETKDSHPTLIQVLVEYRRAQAVRFSGHTVMPHQLYIHTRQSELPLSSSIYQWTCPLQLSWDKDVLHDTLRDHVIARHHPEVAAQLRSLRVQVYESRKECDARSEAVVYSISHTRGSVYADTVLVDTTIAWAKQAAGALDTVGALEKQLQALESSVLKSEDQAMLQAGLLVYECLLYLTSHQPIDVSVTPRLYVQLFQAVIKTLPDTQQDASMHGHTPQQATSNHAAADNHSQQRQQQNQAVYNLVVKGLLQRLDSHMLPAHASTLSLLVILRMLHMQNDITAHELSFIMTIIREGVPDTALRPPKPATPTVKPCTTIATVSTAGLLAGQARPGNPSIAGRANNSCHAEQGIPSTQDGVDRHAFTREPKVHPLNSPGTAAILAWLEAAYPNNIFQGIGTAIAACPEAWHAVLMSDDLSTPAIRASTLAPGSRNGQPVTPPVYTSANELASLSNLAAAITSKTAGRTSPATTDQCQQPDPVVATRVTPIGNLVAQATNLRLGHQTGTNKSASSTLPTPQGTQPEQWAQARLTSPVYWWLLVAVICRESRFVAAVRWLTSCVLGGDFMVSTQIPGESLLSAIAATPASTITVLASTNGVDAVSVLHQAVALSAAGQQRGSNTRSRPMAQQQLVVMSAASMTEQNIGKTLRQAVDEQQRLVLLDAHTAQHRQLLLLLKCLLEMEHLLRGDDIAFRLFLAVPVSARSSLPVCYNHHSQTLRLTPSESLAAEVKANVTLLAHSSAGQLNFFAGDGTADVDKQVLTFATLATLATLEYTLQSQPLTGSQQPLHFSRHELLHAVQLVCQVLAQLRHHDPTADLVNIRFPVLHSLLMTNVILPAIPSSHMASHAQNLLVNILSGNLLLADHPIHMLQPDAEVDSNSTAGLPATAPWPNLANTVVGMLSAIDTLLDTSDTTLSSIGSMTTGCRALGIANPTPDSPSALEMRTSRRQTSTNARLATMPAGLRPSHAEMRDLGRSLDCQGPWPLKGLLRYGSTTSAQHAVCNSKALNDVLASLTKPPPWVSSNASMSALAAGRNSKGRSPSPIRMLKAAAPELFNSEIINSLQSGSRTSTPSSQQPLAGASKHRTAHAGGHTKQHADACMAVRVSANQDAYALPIQNQEHGIRLSNIGADWARQLVTTTTDLHAMLLSISQRFNRSVPAARAWLSIQNAKPRGLHNVLDTLFVQAMLQETAQLRKDTRRILIRLACIHAYLQQRQSPHTAQVFADIMAMSAGFAPNSWLPDSNVLPKPCTLHAWRKYTQARYEHLQQLIEYMVGTSSTQHSSAQAAGQQLLQTSQPGSLAQLPPVDLSLLTLPCAIMGILTRAHAEEQSVQLANVCCRAVSTPSRFAAISQPAPTASSPSPVQSGSTAWPSTGRLSTRHGICVGGWAMQDGALQLPVDTQGMPHRTDTYEMCDAVQGTSASPVPALCIIPVYGEAHGTSAVTSRPSSRPGRLGSRTGKRRASSPANGTLVAASGNSISGSMGLDCPPGLLSHISLPIMTGKQECEPLTSLQMVVRTAAGLPADYWRPAGGASLLGILPQQAPITARNLSCIPSLTDNTMSDDEERQKLQNNRFRYTAARQGSPM